MSGKNCLKLTVMDYNLIRSLLEKYWNCETSLEEEAILRKYFSEEKDIPDDIKTYIPLFQYFRSGKEVSLGEDFDEKVLARLPQDERSSKHRYLSVYYKIAAAVILLLFLVTIHQRFIAVKEKAIVVVQDTFDDPQKALEETKKTLMLVSEKWNKGKSNLGKLSEFNKAEKIIRNEKL